MLRQQQPQWSAPYGFALIFGLLPIGNLALVTTNSSGATSVH